MKLIRKEAFAVIGKEGSTRDGDGFIQRLWAEANGHFAEIAHLALRNEQGVPQGCWGAMTDFGRRFQPWEEGFTRGLYLAGVECDPSACAPEGWTKWDIPAFTFLQVDNSDGNAFARGLAYLKEQGLTLAGAIQDFTDPATGQDYMMFSVDKP